MVESLADRLDTLRREAHTTDDLARGIDEIVRQTDKCPVCTALITSEHDAITDIAATTTRTTHPLCLGHLARVLAAGPTSADGRSMVHALATALRRDSEDMRAFALKREALHSELVSDEESRAYPGYSIC